MNIRRTVEDELHELRGVFPTLSRKDFYRLDNGNICVKVKYKTTGPYSLGTFNVLIEFPHNYPSAPPHAWITEPKISKKVHHVHRTDEYGHTEICYLRPLKDWHYTHTAYDAAIMIQTWVWAYCKWRKTGIWDWEEV
jgi:ubiquitin-protein ligase